VENIYHAKIGIIAIGIFGKPNKPDYKFPHSLRNRTLFDANSAKITQRYLLLGTAILHLNPASILFKMKIMLL